MALYILDFRTWRWGRKCSWGKHLSLLPWWVFQLHVSCSLLLEIARHMICHFIGKCVLYRTWPNSTKLLISCSCMYKQFDLQVTCILTWNTWSCVRTCMYMCMIVDRLYIFLQRLNWAYGPLSETSSKCKLGLLMRMRECRSVTAELSPRWTSCLRPALEQSGKLSNLEVKEEFPNLFTRDLNSWLELMTCLIRSVRWQLTAPIITYVSVG